MKAISIKELEQIASRRPGLLIGPGASVSQNFLVGIGKALGVTSSGFPFDDTEISHADPSAAMRKQVATATEALGVNTLGGVYWSCILSAAPDRYLEDYLSEDYAKIANRPTVDVLSDDLSRPPTDPSLAVYKLLGDVATGNFTVGEAAYQKRKVKWPSAIRTFRDATKSATTVCMGFKECPRVLFDLLSAMMQAQALPRYLVFLADDPLVKHDTLLGLLEGAAQACALSATTGELVRAVQRTRVVRVTKPAALDKEAWPTIALHSFEHLATVVNRWVGATPKTTERNRLTDLLFAPQSRNWDPYVAELDLRRALEPKILADIREHVELKKTDSAAAVVLGASATGKTTLLKRLALELAKEGELCIWLNPTLHTSSDLLIRDMFGKIAEQMPKLKQPVIIFMDDPGSFASGTARQVAIGAERAEVPVVLVQAIRTSEWDPTSTSATTGTLPVLGNWTISDELSEGELAALAAVLVKLDVVATDDDANRQLAAAKSKHARDCLAVLYTLIPQSRAVISDSVREEHLRLGQPKTLARVVSALASQSSAPLQRAYEFVSVSTTYDVPAPVEVLVSALEIDYDTWIGETADGTAAWGILYPTETDDDDVGSYYATRNGIVAETILEALNAGALGHSGEVRVLRELLGACSGSQLFYREFCVRILTSRAFKHRLEFEEGLKLFDTALGALPFADKTILHHKGRWIKNEGGDPVRAREVLYEALAAENYPNARRLESDAHIYTSLAATAVDAVELNKIDAAEGKREILSCLTHSRATGKFDPTATHVQANAIAKLAKRSPLDNDMLRLANTALRAVDDNLFTLNAARRDSPVRMDDKKMLESVKMRLMSQVIKKHDDTGELADTLWEQHQSQEGFVFQGTKLANDAMESRNRGEMKAAYEFIRSKVDLVESADVAPGRELLRLAVHVLFDWRVNHAARGTADLKTVWPELEALAIRCLRGVGDKEDPATRYVYALTLAHLNNWHGSRAAFQQLRASGLPRVFLWAPRHLLLGRDGHPRRVQGTIRKGPKGGYLASSQLDNDFQLERRGEWPPVGNVSFVNIEFAYGGPTAIKPQD